jgi:quercetin dioxygenase-like cupin family protein
MTTFAAATAYRWTDLPRDRPMERLARRRIIGSNLMISEVLLERGCLVPMHAHENEQFACIMRGRLRFTIGAWEGQPQREVVVAAGEVMHLPSNVPHAAEALEETLVLDLFSPPSATTGIDRGPATAHG